MPTLLVQINYDDIKYLRFKTMITIYKDIIYNVKKLNRTRCTLANKDIGENIYIKYVQTLQK